MKKLFFKLMILSIACDSFAYDGDKCGQQVFRKNIAKASGLGGVIMTMYASTVSTTQFISSWGSCSMFGLIEHEQKQLLADAGEAFVIDLAKGKGDFLDAYADISKCNYNGRAHLINDLRFNFEAIYDLQSKRDIDIMNAKINKIMNSDPKVFSNCRLSNDLN